MSQIFDEFSFSLFQNLGPILVLNEIYNYLYKKYRDLQKNSTLSKESDNLREYNELLHSIKLFDNVILDDIFFTHKQLKLVQIKNIFGKEYKHNYLEISKQILTSKKNIMSSIYKTEFDYLQNKISIKISFHNYLIQVGIIIFTFITLLLTIFKN